MKQQYRVRNWSQFLDATKARHVVVDSTGIEVYGEGEWKVREHGVGKRRTCLKMPLQRLDLMQPFSS